MTLTEYIQEYRRLYAEADELFKKYNPCEPHSDGTCICTRENPGYTNTPTDRCCTGCRYHSREQGCLTIALFCKIWVCGFLSQRIWSRRYSSIQEFGVKLKTIQERFDNLIVVPESREALPTTINRFTMYNRTLEAHDTHKTASAGQLGR